MGRQMRVWIAVEGVCARWLCKPTQAVPMPGMLQITRLEALRSPLPCPLATAVACVGESA